MKKQTISRGLRLTIAAKLIFYTASIFILFIAVLVIDRSINHQLNQITEIQNEFTSIWKNTSRMKAFESEFFIKDTKSLDFYKNGSSNQIVGFDSLKNVILEKLQILLQNEVIENGANRPPLT